MSPRIPGGFQHPIGIVTRTHQDMDRTFIDAEMDDDVEIFAYDVFHFFLPF